MLRPQAGKLRFPSLESVTILAKVFFFENFSEVF
jgi:hypothetical protein